MATISRFLFSHGIKNGTCSFACAAVFLLITSCSENKPEQERPHSIPLAAEPAIIRNYLIQGDSVGNLRVGSPVDSVYNLFPKDRLRKETYEQEGMAYTALEVYHDSLSQPSLVLSLNCNTAPCIVRSIAIRDTSYHTASGLRIGSTYGELKKKQETAYIGWGEGAFLAVSAGLPLTFEFDISGIGESNLGKLSAATLPDSTRITRMFMFNPRPAKAPAELEQRPE